MNNVIRIDFETRSHCDLLAAGAWEYSRHPTTEVLCYAFKVDDEPTEGRFVAPWLDLYDVEVETLVPYFLSLSGDYEAHNVGFELAIWENQMSKKHGWPLPDIERFYCSAAKAAAHGLPRSLDGAARAMGLDVEKDAEGHRLMLKLSKPRPTWKKKGTGAVYFESTEEFKRLLEYCKQDVRAEYALSDRLKPLSAPERKTFLLDLKINRRGVHCDRALVEKAIQLNAFESAKGNQTLSTLTGGAVQTTNQRDKILAYLAENYNFIMPNLQAETVDAALDSDISGRPRQILELRQRHSKSSVKKYAAMLARISDDNRIRETLLYSGAHTGRWTGIKIQPHNYPRPQFKRFDIEELLIPAIMDNRPDLLELYHSSVSHALSDTLRSALTAAPGHQLIGADYASIEARVLSWLAGEQWAVDMFADGADIYLDMASTIYGVDLKVLLDLYALEDPDAIAKRNVGKSTVLGCGYQMGAPRFRAECEKKGIFLPPEMATKIIKAYRAKYRRVVKLWYNIHKTALRALSGNATTTVGRPLIFGRRGQFLYLKLPSGRLLAYKDPEIRINRFRKKALSHMHVHPVSKKWVRTTTYGGALVENLVQAIARDIMALAMHRAEAAGYKIVMSVHDELVAEVPKGFGSVKEFERLLCVVPDWAEGCPIAAEGWMGERYRK